MTATPDEPWQDATPPAWIYSLLGHYQARQLGECDAILRQHSPTEVTEWLIVVAIGWAQMLFGAEQLPIVLSAHASLAETAAVMDETRQP